MSEPSADRCSGWGVHWAGLGSPTWDGICHRPESQGRHFSVRSCASLPVPPQPAGVREDPQPLRQPGAALGSTGHGLPPLLRRAVEVVLDSGPFSPWPYPHSVSQDVPSEPQVEAPRTEGQWTTAGPTQTGSSTWTQIPELD